MRAMWKFSKYHTSSISIDFWVISLHEWESYILSGAQTTGMYKYANNCTFGKCAIDAYGCISHYWHISQTPHPDFAW